MSITSQDVREARKRRHLRVRKKVFGKSDKPRLCVFRSLNHIYTQIIDDVAGHTITSASTLTTEIKEQTNNKAKASQAELVGALIAKQAIAKGIKQVVFDRGGYKYHGRIKALAEAARKAGLKF